jgi:hypothetical protein
MGDKLNTRFSEEKIQMTNKHMKNYSISLAMKEMQIKATLRFQLTPVILAIKKKTNNNKCWWGYGGGGKGTLIPCWWKYKLLQPLWKSVWSFLKKLKWPTLWPRHTTIPHLAMYLKEFKLICKRNISISKFIAAVFIIT